MPDPEPPPAESEGQRVNRLTTVYTDRVQPSKFPAVAGVVRQAVRATVDGRVKYTDQQIIDALGRMAEDGRSVTVDSLRYELDGIPPTTKPAGNGAEKRHQSQGFHDGIALARRLHAEEQAAAERLALEGARS
jgi:hypothetical protein